MAIFLNADERGWTQMRGKEFRIGDLKFQKGEDTNSTNYANFSGRGCQGLGNLG